jgi:hypothetical protein
MVWVRRSLQKVRAGLMAGVCLGAVAAHATDATWSPDAANNNWNDGANWVSNPPHVVPDGTATFAPSSKTTIVLGNAGNTVIDNITFAQTAPAYTILIGAGQGLSVNGSGAGGGVSNNSSVSPNFLVFGALSGLAFFNNAGLVSFTPADFNKPASPAIIITNGTGGTTSFYNNSSAGTPNNGPLRFLPPRSTTTLAAQPNSSTAVLPTSRTSQTRAMGPSYSSTQARPAVPLLRMLLQGGK